jgi:DNA-binding beta-propeller fold protein YncE
MGGWSRNCNPSQHADGNHDRLIREFIRDGAGTLAKFDRQTGLYYDSSGDLYVADTANNAIRKITPGEVVTTLKIVGSPLDSPTDITKYGQFFYVSNYRTGRIWFVNYYSGSIGSFLEGDTDFSVTAPAGLIVDPYGTLFFVDALKHRIAKKSLFRLKK